jgi:hypothetical protein
MVVRMSEFMQPTLESLLEQAKTFHILNDYVYRPPHVHIQMGSLQITLTEKQARLWVEAALKVYLRHYPPTLGPEDHGV